MVRTLHIVLFLLAAGALLLPSAISAQEPCLEGRTAKGDCVNAGLAASLRQGSIIFSRPELSQTAQPIMPQLDYKYRYPHELTTVPPVATPMGQTFGLPTCFPNDVFSCP